MVFKDYYKILGLETNRVTMDELKVAYRAAAKKHHPDLNVGNNLAEEIIKDINEAYKILSVPATKRKYDRKWNLYVGRKSNLFDKNGNSKEVLKGMLFGSDVASQTKKTYRGKPIKGENIETSININIYEAFHGLEKKISLKNEKGKAKILAIEIPKGIRQGEKIRLIGQGKAGKNGGKAGDLLIKINIQNDKQNKLKGENIYNILEITPWEAALGKKIVINSIDGEEAKIYIPQGTQSGEKFTILNRGYIKEDGTRGNLILETKIMVPKKLTNEEKKIFEKLDKLSNYNPREGDTHGKFARETLQYN